MMENRRGENGKWIVIGKMGSENRSHFNPEIF